MRSGKGKEMGTTLPGQLESQWSLTFEVRKRVLSVGNWYLPTMSQWSLTFEVRKRQPCCGRLQRGGRVAMEPDL